MIMAKDSNNNYVKIEDIKQQNSFNGISPIEFKGSGENLENYRIYGNTISGESVGDKTDNIIRDYAVVRTQAQYAAVLFIDTELIPNTTYSFTCLLNSSELRLYINENLFNTIRYVKDDVVLKVIVKTLSELPDSQKINGKWIMLKNSITEPVVPELSNIMMIKGSEMPAIYEPYGYRVPVTVTGKNLLINKAKTKTINGVKFTVNDDGSVTCNGFTNELIRFNILSLNNSGHGKVSGNFIINGSPGVDGTLMKLWVDDLELPITSEDVTYNGTVKRLCIQINGNTTVNDVTFFPMIRNVNIEDGTFEPYQIPVTTNIYLPEQIKKVGEEVEYIDYKEQKQHRVRKNLLNYSSIEIGRFDFSTGEKVPDSSQIRTSTPIKVKPNESYAISGVASGQVRVFLYDGNMKMISTVLRSDNSVVETTGSTVFVNVAGIKSAWSEQIQLEIGSEATGYEPYIEDTELNVTLPALPTLSGINILSVNTNTKPSKVWGRLSDPKDILYVKDNLGNTLFSKYHETSINGSPPLTYKAKKEGNLSNYLIYGDTINGESVGDKTDNLFDGNFLQGYWAYADGNFRYTNRWICTTKIPCAGSRVYTYYFSNLSRWTGFVWYDADGEYISTSNQQNQSDIPYRLYYAAAPSNAEFMAVNIAGYPSDLETISPIDVTDFMLVEGQYTIETMPAYEPYGYRVPVTVSNGTDTKTTNLYLPEQIKMVEDVVEHIDFGAQKLYRVRKNLFNGALIDGVYADNTLNNVDMATGVFKSLSVHLNAGTYTLSFSTNVNVVRYVEKNVLYTINPAINVSSYTFTLFNANRIGFSFRDATSSTTQWDNNINIMLNSGSEPLPYEPYIENTELDVTLPALPTLSGTNTLTVGTEVQPSEVDIKGKIKEIN